MSILPVLFLFAAALPAHCLQYPAAPRSSIQDDYFGTIIADPFRGLEDPDSPETKQWLDAQKTLTAGTLAKLPGRKQLRQRLEELWEYEKYGVPSMAGGRYFYTVDTGKADFPVLYVKTPQEPRAKVLLDPNTFSKDGTVALTRFAPSQDGKLLAYGVTKSGSDWRQWRVVETDTGKVLPDLVSGIKWSSPSWSKDGKGFFYSRYPEAAMSGAAAAENEKVYYHRLGAKPEDDVLVFTPGDAKWMTLPRASDDGRYLVLHVYKSSDGKYAVKIMDLSGVSWGDPASIAKAAVVGIGDDFRSEFAYLDNIDTTFYFKTTYQAPKARIVAVDLRAPDLSKLREIVPEGADPIDDAGILGGKLLVSRVKDARTRVDLYDLNGKFLKALPLPGSGTVFGFPGQRADQETFFAFQNYVTPASIYRYDLAQDRSEVFQAPQVKFRPQDFVTQQVFYRSADGTFVPLSISHRRGITLDGRNPTWLYGYGCYGNVQTPNFGVSRIAWMERGGVFAVANIRGGGEYGDQWHQDGMAGKKQNSIDDFSAAAQWLIDNRYTSPRRLAVNGASCGGLLAGASLVQRPDLFGAAVVEVGILDLLRFHKFTGAYLWTDELGSSEKPGQFRYLRSLSPVHNVKAGLYPATLITTADHDTRVVPAHSFKFAAALQAAQKGEAPILLRVEKDAGHGEGMAKGKLLDLSADRLIFAWDAINRP
ncbi:MAG: prolyl oligopeptidase family serine peptidase [Elusimicrobia bacterium]|nr:prolyl oligopeptidase family serine peptidase [Elusimicrobiota bacterium]